MCRGFLLIKEIPGPLCFAGPPCTAGGVGSGPSLDCMDGDPAAVEGLDGAPDNTDLRPDNLCLSVAR